MPPVFFALVMRMPHPSTAPLQLQRRSLFPSLKTGQSSHNVHSCQRAALPERSPVHSCMLPQPVSELALPMGQL